jgi:hypothetical protein
VADGNGWARIWVTLPPSTPRGSVRSLEAVVTRPGPPFVTADRTDALVVRVGP